MKLIRSTIIVIFAVVTLSVPSVNVHGGPFGTYGKIKWFKVVDEDEGYVYHVPKCVYSLKNECIRKPTK